MLKKLFAIALAIALCTGGNVPQASAQTSQGPKDLGFAYAVDYSKWVFRSNGDIASGAQTVTIRGDGFATTAGGQLFYPLATNAPITVDAENAAVTETVTPSAVTCAQNSLQTTCTVTATFSNAHTGNFTIKSGTFGLCEARNAVTNVATGGTVVVANGWGGSTSTITSSTLGGACDTTLVNILDVRAGVFQFYTSTGTVYAASSSPLTGVTAPHTTVGTAVGAPFIFNAQDTTTNWNFAPTSIGADVDPARIAGLKTRSNNADGRATTTVVAGDDLFEIAAYGADGTDYVKTASILFDSIGTIATGRVGSVIKFFTGTDAAPTVSTLALTLGADQSAVFAGAITNTGTLTMAGTAVINKTSGALTLQTTTSGNIVLAPAAAATAAVTVSTRFEQAKGADVASGGCSSGDCTLGGAGNYFFITGTTAVDGFATAGWTAGSIIVVHTDGNITFNNNGTVAGGFGALLLVGAANVSMTADDQMMLIFDGTNWQQLAPTLVK